MSFICYLTIYLSDPLYYYISIFGINIDISSIFFINYSPNYSI